MLVKKRAPLFTRKGRLEIVFQIRDDEFDGFGQLGESLPPVVTFATGRWRFVESGGRGQKWIDLDRSHPSAESNQLEGGDFTAPAQEPTHTPSEHG